MSIFKDIDLSFIANYYNDIASVTDTSAVKQTIINNLMISEGVRPFSNSIEFRSLDDWFHTEKSQSAYNELKRFIKKTLDSDPRIIKVDDINIIDTSDYEMTIELIVIIDFGTEVKTNLSLTVTKE